MNFDTTNGQPFPRITNVQISYPIAPAMPQLTYDEVMCVIDSAGIQHILEGSASQQSIALNLAESRTPIQMVSPSTGADIQDAMTSYTSLMMSILAITRRDQKARIYAPPAPAPESTPAPDAA
jgi:hypothetical protein